MTERATTSADKRPLALVVRQWFCRHAFRLCDLHKTGIPEPDKPSAGASLQEWMDYQRAQYEGPHHTQRVEWPCARCGKVFRAHCGLDISPTHGPIIPTPNAGAVPRRNDVGTSPLLGQKSEEA